MSMTLDKAMILLTFGIMFISLGFEDEIRESAEVRQAEARALAEKKREAAEDRARFAGYAQAAEKAAEEEAKRVAKKEAEKEAKESAEAAAALIGAAALWMMSEDSPCEAAKKACQCLQDTSCDDVDDKTGFAACVYFKKNCR